MTAELGRSGRSDGNENLISESYPVDDGSDATRQLAGRETDDRSIGDHATSAPHNVDAQWLQVQTRLLAEVGPIEYRTWLEQMTLDGVNGDEVTLRLPTSFLRDWVRTHYSDRLTTLWQGQGSVVRRVDIRVGAADGRASLKAQAPGAAAWHLGQRRGVAGRRKRARDGAGLTYRPHGSW